MKLRCVFGHRFGGWQEVGEHLERKCLRCGKQQVTFPRWETILAKELVKLANELLIPYLTSKFEKK